MTLRAPLIPKDVSEVLRSLSPAYGSFGHTRVKPNSAAAVSDDGQFFLKIYRNIQPEVRQAREIEALNLAPKLGIRVPNVVGAGQHGALPWILLDFVRGEPGRANNSAEIASACNRARALMDRLRQQVGDRSTAHLGWLGPGREPTKTSEFLVGQFSARAPETSAWPAVREAAQLLDGSTIVRLHGDIKPEHFIAQGELDYVVDWEACAYGPSVCDEADFLFHLVRDLVYLDGHVDLLPTVRTDDLNALAAAAVLRLALWADRRRLSDLGHISLTTMMAMMGSESERELARKLVRTVSEMKSRGTPG